MRILVLGGGGFIGSTIADRLLQCGHSIRIFERPRVTPYRKFSASEAVEWFEGDVMSSHNVVDALQGVDAVMHLVSTTLPKNSNEDPIYDVQSNIVATLQLLNAMVSMHIKRVVFISSGGTIYGTPQYTPIDERHPTNPIVSYGVTKLAIEKYLHIYQHSYGLQPVTLRVANPYGERQRYETAQGAVGVFMHKALLNQPIDIWGDGEVTRDYIHVSDVADAFVKALDYQGAHSIFNISSGQGTSLKELLGMLEGVLARPIARRHLPARHFDVPLSILSSSLAQTELGWAPQVSMTEGLSRTAKWMASTLDR